MRLNLILPHYPKCMNKLHPLHPKGIGTGFAFNNFSFNVPFRVESDTGFIIRYV